MAQKAILGTIWDNMTQEPLFYVLFSQMPLRNSIAIATTKVPGDQKLFERVCYMLKLKVTKFQLPTHNGFRVVLDKRADKPPPPVQNRVHKLKSVIMQDHTSTNRLIRPLKQ